MDTKRIDSFKEFAKHFEYPMVVFEANSGKVLDVNYEAEVLLGGKVQTISISPGKAMIQQNFWELLHGKKTLIWHRIRLVADGREHLVSGLINETKDDENPVYTLLFERRADLNIGSLTLERIVNHTGLVAIHLGREREKEYKVEYVSQNINKYGYTKAQLYDKVITVYDIVCQEDVERVRESIAEAAEQRIEDGVVECRILTEEQEILPVRLFMHYTYDVQGVVTDIEILLVDLKEERKRLAENSYLSNAVSKMKSVVLVKTYRDGKRILKYLSPNAGILGMNVEALQKGYKLTEDYIHPEDRDAVLDAIYQAVANGVTDYVQTYRLVRDNGNIIWVETEITINRISDGEAEISFLLTDITENKNIEKELAVPVEDTASEYTQAETSGQSAKGGEFLKDLQIMADTLMHHANYYGVMLDKAGKFLTNPTGPMHSMGQFFDLFERPQFKELFHNLTEQVNEVRIPSSATIVVDGMDVHMAFAPLIVDDYVMAYWVLASYEKDGKEQLNDVTGPHWQLVNSVAKYFYAEQMIEEEEKLRKLTEVKLHREEQERHVIQDLISSMSREGQIALAEMSQKVGTYLNIENIGFFLQNMEDEKMEKYYVWNATGEIPSSFDALVFSDAEYKEMRNHFKQSPMIMINHQTEVPFLKELLRRTGMSMLILYSMKRTSGVPGYIVFADSQKKFVEEKDRSFVQSVFEMFENVVASSNRVMKPEILKESFLDAYDHIRDAVFVKDNKSGEIIFANKAMDKLFGYSIVGMRATDVVKDQLEQYRNIQGVRKRFISNKKVLKWQSYMQELDQIMNIVEVHMEMLTGSECSLFILKKNKNK